MAQVVVAVVFSFAACHLLTPMAMMIISSCTEACRAAALASHSAAGLVTSVKKVAATDATKLAEVARMLRSAESLARAATASLSVMAALARSASPACPAGSVDAGTPAAGVPSKAARRKNRKKVSEKDVLPYEVAGRSMDVDNAVAIPALLPTSPLEVSSCSGPSSTTLGNVQAAPFYPVGSSVILFGLASRKDLEGTLARVIAAPSAADERVAVRLPSGEQVRVRHQNVKPSIFSAGHG